MTDWINTKLVSDDWLGEWWARNEGDVAMWVGAWLIATLMVIYSGACGHKEKK
jgi:hypothetical protein